MRLNKRVLVWSRCFFFFSSRRRHTRYWRDWSSDVCSSDLVFEVDEASWNAVVDANLKGTFFAAQAAARHMVAGGEGGRIINVASQAGVVGIEERSAYGASKGGTVVLTKVLAIELARRGITVNAVAPTFIATELTRGTLEDPAWRERILSRIPLGRVGEVEEVAAATVYLASPAAALVTGHTLVVDGGWTAW